MDICHVGYASHQTHNLKARAVPRIAGVIVIHVKQAPLVRAVIPVPCEAEGLELVFSHGTRVGYSRLLHR